MNEYAVMIDTRDPLTVADLPDNVEVDDYLYSWTQHETATK